jgi:hypothetical protein
MIEAARPQPDSPKGASNPQERLLPMSWLELVRLVRDAPVGSVVFWAAGLICPRRQVERQMKV